MARTSSPLNPVTHPDDLGTLLPSWLRSLRAAGLAPTTVSAYSRSLQSLRDDLQRLGRTTILTALRTEDLEGWMGDLLLRRSRGTAAHRFRALQQFFKWAIRERLIPHSPMGQMRQPRVIEQPPAVLTDAQLAALLATCAGSDLEARRDTAIIRLLIDTGCRLAEITGLHYLPDGSDRSDLDLQNDFVHFTGKGGRRRTNPFGIKTGTALDRYLRLRAAHRHAGRPELWLARKGRFGRTGIQQMIRRRGRVAGISDSLHPHQFRHTNAHASMASGMSESDLMNLRGWRSHQMVRRYGASAAHERAIQAGRKATFSDRV